MTKTWFEISARAEATTAEAYIFDEIGAYGVTAKDFITALEPYKGRALKVRINSPGGSVFEGLAIYNALTNWTAHVECHIEGLAASIASVIAMAGKTIIAPENAMIMIHDPSAMIDGNAVELRKFAGTLDKIAGNMAAIYANRTKRPLAEISQIMAGEKWFTAAEAKAAGFIDSISAPMRIAAQFNLKAYAKVPPALVPDVVALQSRVAELEQKYDAEVRQRITTKVEALQPGRFPIAQSERWIEDALKDETVLDRLAEISQSPLGTEAVSGEFTPTANNQLEQAHANYRARLTSFRNPKK